MYLNEDLFEEVGVSEDYLAEGPSLLTLLSERDYNPKGFWGTSLGRQVLATPKGAQLKNDGYEAHHINGVHLTSSTSPHNSEENIALLQYDLHLKLNKDSREIVKGVLEDGFGDPTIGRYIMKLWVYATNNNKDISNYIEIQQDLYGKIKQNSLSRIEDNFFDNYYDVPGHSGIYLVTDLLSQEG